jgi:hypothetical protein
MPGAPCRGRISGRPVRAGKLKNWKSEKLTSQLPALWGPARQNSRISLAPRCTVRGRGGAILNVRFRGRSCRSRDTENIVDAVFLLGDYRPESDIPRIPVKVADAAIVTVPAQQPVLTLSANSGHTAQLKTAVEATQ